MKSIFYCVSVCILIFAKAVNADIENSYSREQKIQLHMIEKMSQQGISQKFKLNEVNAKAMADAIRNGQPITDTHITKNVEIGFLSGIPPYPLSTVGNENGPIIIDKYPIFKNELLNISLEGPTQAEKSAMKNSSKDCKGQFKTLSSGATAQEVKNCFMQLDELSTIISPETSKDKTYLRGLPAITSIVDKNKSHQCIASFYAKDTWITASHCLSYQQINAGRWLLTSGIWIQITKIEPACFPSAPCDIILINIPTPTLIDSDTPYISLDTQGLDSKTELFIPGIPIDMVLKDNFSGVAYRKTLMWNPVGQGYCRMQAIEKSGCIVHSCSTLTGFSGAPIYSYDRKKDRINLIGIHSGDDPKKNNCEATAQANFAHVLPNKGDAM